MLVMLFPDFFQSLEYQSNLVCYQPRGKQSNRNEDTQNPQELASQKSNDMLPTISGKISIVLLLANTNYC